MFRVNPQHIGIYQTSGVPQFNELKLKFKTENPVDSSPAVADGVVYFGTEDGLYAIQ